MVNGTNEKRLHYDKIRVRNILLSCSSGLATSYYAYMMNEFLKNADIDIHVEAISYTEIERVADDYNVILLVPQIKYLLPELKLQYGHKVFTMNTQDFATNNYMHVLEYLSTKMEKI